MNRSNVTQSILAELAESKAQQRRAQTAFTRAFRSWLVGSMQTQSVTADVLAAQLQCSRRNIYRILHAENTTTKTIASLAHALGFNVSLRFEPMEVSA